MSDIIETIRARGLRMKLPFQQGILMSIKSLKDLFEYLSQEYTIRYITTVKLNQDVLECFFSYIRGMGHQNTHLTPVEFKYRMRNYVMDKHSAAVFSTKRNVDERVEETCLVTDIQGRSSHQEGTNENVLLEKEFRLTISLGSAAIDETTSDIPELCDSQIFNSDIASREGLNYLAGYVAHRLRGKHPELCEINPTKGNTWIDSLSRGNLTKASQNFVNAIIVGHVARMGESRNAYRMIVGRPEGKRPLERPRRRWENNIKMDLRGVGYDDIDWIDLAQNRDRWLAYLYGTLRNSRHCGSNAVVFEYYILFTLAFAAHICPLTRRNNILSSEYKYGEGVLSEENWFCEGDEAEGLRVTDLKLYDMRKPRAALK
ncbi:hypothetical protein ANN_17559 [Periplaneta americana]|uniref:Transposable element P transposase-like RNase H C-terminal domain-containing protein n=1 Tax=Periplaneta americana TaxID=6978 RepID=A0ABQ8SVE2_PERAM|nr:hypothetical protein ANN_17559 [Periplaneta americana]